MLLLHTYLGLLVIDGTSICNIATPCKSLLKLLVAIIPLNSVSFHFAQFIVFLFFYFRDWRGLGRLLMSPQAAITSAALTLLRVIVVLLLAVLITCLHIIAHCLHL